MPDDVSVHENAGVIEPPEVKRAATSVDGFSERLLAAVSERNTARVIQILAAQRGNIRISDNSLDREAEDHLVDSVNRALLLANLQRAHLLESLKNCQHQLAILQAYQESYPAKPFEESHG